MHIKFLAVTLTLVASLQGPFANAEDTPWIADGNGCKVANPYPQAKESITWSGPCEGGYAQGDGTLQWFEGGSATARYEGSLNKGWASGRGMLTSPNGAIYKGEWKDSRENGEGRLDWPDGSWYEGQWRDGKPNGYGQYRSPEGRMLTGKFVDGVFEPDAKDQEELPPGQTKT